MHSTSLPSLVTNLVSAGEMAVLMVKKIASAARTDCEEFLGCRVNLQCWVKVKADWRDNEFMLNNFGFKQQPSR